MVHVQSTSRVCAYGDPSEGEEVSNAPTVVCYSETMAAEGDTNARRHDDSRILRVLCLDDGGCMAVHISGRISTTAETTGALGKV